jgi:biotin-independent malonate decarboxylase gamma subunit
MSRGMVWFDALCAGAAARADMPPSVRVADASIGDRAVRFIAVVPDSQNRFRRARSGELGIDEGCAIARAVDDAPGAIVAIVDVPGQAFGLREEMLGIHRALAAAVDAYARKRRAGHTVLALVVGRAISGAFLAHGLQANWIAALRDPGIEVHVMSEPSVARVTRMTREEITRIAAIVPATARDIERFASLGAVDRLFDVADPENPSMAELALVCSALGSALDDPQVAQRTPRSRLDAPEARVTRALSRDVRARLRAAWDV